MYRPICQRSYTLTRGDETGSSSTQAVLHHHCTSEQEICGCQLIFSKFWWQLSFKNNSTISKFDTWHDFSPKPKVNNVGLSRERKRWNLSVAIFSIKISIFSVGFHNDNILFLTIDKNYGIFPIWHDLNIHKVSNKTLSTIYFKTNLFRIGERSHTHQLYIRITSDICTWKCGLPKRKESSVAQ